MSNALNLSRNAFRSRIVRQLVGERTIDLFTSLTQPEPAQGGGNQGGGGALGFFRNVFNIGSRLTGFLIQSVLNFGGWLLRNLWDILVTAYYEFVNFDWNQTDASIRQQIQGNENAIASALGSLAGTGLVWTSAVLLAGGLTFKFPVIAGQVALSLAEEGGEEIRAQIAAFLSVAAQSTASNFILGGFLTLRRLRLFGLAPINDQREPWTIAEAIEERIEQIPDSRLRAFVESFLESVEESIIEAGYVVSYTLEDIYQANRMAVNNTFGTERALRIIPDERTEQESIVISGPQTFVQQQTQSVIATHQLIHNRDVGLIVGQPAEDWMKAGVQRRKLTIVFKSKERPPWIVPGGRKAKEITVTVPEVERGLTWQELKTAARKFTWGRYRATANLDNGRQMAIYGATEQEAETKLRELKTLTLANIVTLSVTEEKDRNPNLRKEATEMWPAYATLLIRRPTTDPTGRTDLQGNTYNQETIRIDLWPESEPPNLPPLQ